MGRNVEVNGSKVRVVSLKPSDMTSKKCNVSVHLKHKLNDKERRLSGVMCHSWSCSRCVPYMRKNWLAHLDTKMREGEVVSGRMTAPKPIYILSTNKRRWETIGKRVYRAGGEFATVEQPDSSLIIFTNVDVGGESVPSLSLGATLKAVIDSCATGRKPIRTSAGWRRNVAEDEKHRSNYTLINLLRVPVGRAVDEVRQHGVNDVREWESKSRFGADYAVPEQWGWPQVSELDNDLAELEE